MNNDVAIAAVEQKKRRDYVVSLPVPQNFDDILPTESWIDGT